MGRNSSEKDCKCTNSRHKYHHTPPGTPPHFWEAGINSQQMAEMDNLRAEGDGGLAANAKRQLEKKKSFAEFFGQ